MEACYTSGELLVMVGLLRRVVYYFLVAFRCLVICLGWQVKFDLFVLCICFVICFNFVLLGLILFVVVRFDFRVLCWFDWFWLLGCCDLGWYFGFAGLFVSYRLPTLGFDY